MNDRQRIHFNIDDVPEKYGPALACAFFDIICVLCFLYSARLMYGNVYHYGTMESAFVMRVIVMVLIVSVLSYVAENFGGLGKVVIVLGTMAGGVLWLHYYFETEVDISQIVSGFYRMAELYIEGWNDFYGTMYTFGDDGSYMYLSDCLDITMLIMFFLFLQLAKIRGKNSVLAAVPGIVFVAMLLSGNIPGGYGVFLMAAGMLLANSGGFAKTDFKAAECTKRNMLVWVRCGVMVVAVFFMLAATQGSLAEQTVDTYSEDAKRFTAVTVDNVIKQISRLEAVKEVELSGAFGEMVNVYSADVDTGIERLTNSAPVYKNEPVLEIALNKKPLADMYLKSFCSGDYDDGTWVRDEESFAKACKAAGLDAEQMAENIVTLALNKMKQIKKGDKLSEVSIGSYGNITDLTYTTAVSFPYLTEMNSSSDVEIKGDTWFSKEATTKAVYIDGWNWSGDYEELSRVLGVEKGDWESWYEEYVKQHYLAVPSDMPHVEEIAKELLDQFEFSDNALDSEEKNILRLEKADAVVAWMQKNTRYNLDLPELPTGADPVEYFLGTSREGYCMHYASAATLLLREIGVPARYASGYIAERSLFKAMYTGCKGVVPDDNAHAWVEIYLEGIGWIPVEVTNSYSDRVEEPVERPDVPVTEPTTEPDMPDEPDEPEESTAPSDTQPVNPDDGDDDAPKVDEKDKSDEDEGEEGKKVWPVVLIIVSIPVIILAVLCTVFRIPAIRRYILRRELKYFEQLLEPRKAIQIMNRRLYYRLRLSGKISFGNIQDDEFAAVLRKQYPNVDDACQARYMELVKAAVFSKREMTEEEMRFCYEIYCRSSF